MLAFIVILSKYMIRLTVWDNQLPLGTDVLGQS